MERVSNTSKQVPWNKIITERFVELGMLSEREEWVLRTRIAGMSITEQALKLNMSISTVNRIIADLKLKYDNVEKYDPLLPPRKFSAKETWMDTH